jgi:hypothetical protein
VCYLRDGDRVFETYWTTRRGAEATDYSYALMDLTVYGHRCRQSAGSGFGFGLCCLGSSAGLMAMLVVLGVMSPGWMAAIAVLVTAQKLLPARAALDVPLALRSSRSGF